MPAKLSSLKLDRVDLVPKGANPDAHIVLMKSADAVETVPSDVEKDTKEKESAVENTNTPVDKADTVPAHIQKMLDDQNARIEALAKENADNKAKLEKAEETAAIEKAARERVEFIEKAKTEIPTLKGTPEDKGALVQKLYAGLDKADADAVMDLLKSGDHALKQVMAEKGETGDDDSSDEAIVKIREKADALQAANPRLTKQQAFKKACDENPALFDEYRAAQKGRK